MLSSLKIIGRLHWIDKVGDVAVRSPVCFVHICLCSSIVAISVVTLLLYFIVITYVLYLFNGTLDEDADFLAPRSMDGADIPTALSDCTCLEDLLVYETQSVQDKLSLHTIQQHQ